MSTTTNNKDAKLIAEAYSKILNENRYASQNPEESPLDPTGTIYNSSNSDNTPYGTTAEERGDAPEEQEEPLMKFTYELLYPTSTGYGTHTSGRPDLRHAFASSKEEAIKKIVDKLPGVKDIEKRIVIKSEAPADTEEVDHELKHSQTMSNYYSDKSKSGGHSGD